MKPFERCSMAFVLTFLVVGVTAGMSDAAVYETWQCGNCGEFNCQGYANQSTIEFLPFGYKQGDLYRWNLDATRVLAINATAAGDLYCYLMWRVNGAPILWVSLNNAWVLQDWDTVFDVCSYQTEGTVDCVDFEDPALGSTYAVGTALVDSGQSMTFAAFQLVTGGYATGGYGQIAVPGWCEAGGSGQELVLNNINVQFDFPSLEDGVVIQFGEYGGNVNVNINGDFRNELNFSSVSGSVGGVVVSCAGAGCNGAGQGTLYLVGTVTSLSIGGQEFCIDDVCPRIGD